MSGRMSRIGPAVGRRAVWIGLGVLAALVLPAIGVLAGVALASSAFEDVDPDGTHAAGIDWLAESGVTAGCEVGRFCPTDAVTREQMGTFLHRLSGNDSAVSPSVNAATLQGLTVAELFTAFEAGELPEGLEPGAPADPTVPTEPDDGDDPLEPGQDPEQPDEPTAPGDADAVEALTSRVNELEAAMLEFDARLTAIDDLLQPDEAPDDDAPDGDEPDGDEPDGDEPDGDAPDGDEPNGEEPTPPDADGPAPGEFDQRLAEVESTVLFHGDRLAAIDGLLQLDLESEPNEQLAAAVISLSVAFSEQRDLVEQLEVDVAAREQTVAGLEVEVSRLTTLLAGVSRQNDTLGRDTLRFSGMNVQIVNGRPITSLAPNGLGNLIIGNDRARTSADGAGASQKSGSHYLVVGDGNNYLNYGGIVAGRLNNAEGRYATVLGGSGNTASGLETTVTGGNLNTASGLWASVSGGQRNLAGAVLTSVSGGSNNTASGDASSILGGEGRTVSGNFETIPVILE